MQIQFSGTRVFKTDRLLAGDELRRFASIALAGTKGRVDVYRDAGIPLLGQPNPAKNYVIVQGRSGRADRQIMANLAGRLGVGVEVTAHIEGLNFLPLQNRKTDYPEKRHILASWIQSTFRHTSYKPAQPIQELLAKLTKQEA